MEMFIGTLLLGIAIGILIGTVIEHFEAKKPGHFE